MNIKPPEFNSEKKIVCWFVLGFVLCVLDTSSPALLNILVPRIYLAPWALLIISVTGHSLLLKNIGKTYFARNMHFSNSTISSWMKVALLDQSNIPFTHLAVIN